MFYNDIQILWFSKHAIFLVVFFIKIGMFTYVTGAIYEGEFKDGMFNG